jgi:hypothetical protein
MAARKKKTAKKKPGKSVVSYKEKLAALAQQESDRKISIGGGSATIKLAKGGFKFQGEDLGKTMDVVVVDFVRSRGWYDRPFNEDDPSPPACFALSADGIGMEAHETSPVPQGELCEECWADEWGSAPNESAKACREHYLLGLISADQVGDPDADVAYMRVPPTSLAAWDSYAVKRSKVLNLPALAFITTISFDDDSEFQKLLFDEAGRVEENDLGALFDIRETVHEVLMTAPDVSNYEPPTKKKSKKKTKKKVSKKKTKKKVAKKKKKSRFA